MITQFFADTAMGKEKTRIVIIHVEYVEAQELCRQYYMSEMGDTISVTL
jgi:hypothetical protein